MAPRNGNVIRYFRRIRKKRSDNGNRGYVTVTMVDIGRTARSHYHAVYYLDDD